ncbi:sigma-70 family RNA polymerase sigma factor [Botrimarina mediterranea]|uniref:RNA polymerase sigma factor n=1 Tax=Botrimarina mediterranea TaxID=2528022 RepID=A0A518K567_9BACT|nr:sigma-70 family RNA polymerase sigma factor [Botrimarina mediterranea]QDV72917.1 RNA polymerase sigma factor SigM [Botrimarina mediterranea]
MPPAEPLCDRDKPLKADESTIVGQLGDPETWVDRYGDMLFRFAMLRVGDADAAEDLVQETLLAAWQSRARYSGDCTPPTWLVAILKRRIADYFRKQGRRSTLNRSAAASGKTAVPPQPEVEQVEFWSVVHSCTGDLPDHLARAFRLRTFADESPEDICGSEGISRKNLSVRLHRARQLLRRCLEMRWFGGDEAKRL